MRTFTLGDYTFTAPEQIGAGIVQRYQTGLRKAFLSDHPEARGYDPADKEALFQTWLAEYAESADNAVLILQTTLTATEPGVSITAIYDGLQDPSEAADVIDFFSQGVEKVMSVPSKSPAPSARTKASPTARRKK